jgi:hypothetical protein
MLLRQAGNRVVEQPQPIGRGRLPGDGRTLLHGPFAESMLLGPRFCLSGDAAGDAVEPVAQ